MQAFRDTSDGYGVISKSFHWLMAFLFAWQFGGAMLRLAETESAVQAFMWSTHQPVGFTLWGGWPFCARAGGSSIGAIARTTLVLPFRSG